MIITPNEHRKINAVTFFLNIDCFSGCLEIMLFFFRVEGGTQKRISVSVERMLVSLSGMGDHHKCLHKSLCPLINLE